MENIVMYSTGCPQCQVLKKKLDEKDIAYTIVSDTKLMVEKGFETVPMLEVGEKIMNFEEAVKWVQEKQ